MEQRLALTWAGVPPTSISPPGSAVAVTLNSQNDASGTASIATTEIDYYSFTAGTSGSYVISATTPSSSVDTVLGLFSSTGQRLSYNDDISSSNRDSRITVSLTAGTRYYVGITNYTSSSRGAYTWTIDGPAAAPTVPDDIYEQNDTQATATDLGTLTSNRTISNLALADSADWFKFTTTTTGTSASQVSITFQNTQGNLQLGLYNSAGTLLASSTGTGNTETISLSGRAAGTYSIRVYGNAGALNPSYTLSVTPPVASTPTNPAPGTPFPDVPNYGGANDWNLNAINAPEVWAQGYTGNGVVVAVIDTGVDLDHPELVNQIWVNADEIAGNGVDDDGNGYVDDWRGWDFISNDNNADDANGHGTHVAGTIAAERNGTGPTGVAYDATIMAVRVLDANGSGSWNAVAAGIRYAAANGADIINLSLGGGFSTVIESAIQYAQSLNVLVVAAAGNESATLPGYPARHAATMSNVLSVGAHNSSNAIASFSNDVGTSGAVQVDAPGVNVYSTYMNGGTANFNGTSMASPHVAGLAALALSANPNLTAAQLRTLIVDGANRTISGSDSEGGINAALTVALARSGVTSTSTQATSSALASSGSGRVSSTVAWATSTLLASEASTVADSAGSAYTQSIASVAESRAAVHSSAASRTPAAVDEAILAFDEAALSDFFAHLNDRQDDAAGSAACPAADAAEVWSLDVVDELMASA